MRRMGMNANQNFDGCVKIPPSALRSFPRHCDVRIRTSHSSVLWECRQRLPKGRRCSAIRRMGPYQCAPQGRHIARLEFESFYSAIWQLTFCDFVNFECVKNL
jgi:hypothetical protein